MQRDEEMQLAPELKERAQQMYPLLNCPQVNENEFLLWYDLQDGAHIFYLQGRGRQRFGYVSGHVTECSVCRERYANMKHVTDFFTTIFGARLLREM